MLALAPIYVTLWILWTAVTASPVLVQNATHMSTSEQPHPSDSNGLTWGLVLGKQNEGTPRERWCIFFSKTGTGFTTLAAPLNPGALDPNEKSTIVVMKPGRHSTWHMTDLEATIKYDDPRYEKAEFYDWIQNKMVSTLHLPTTRPDWWPQDTPFDSSPQPMREIFYGGPEPDHRDPTVPPKRRRTGGSSLDMVWVILEELGKRKLYVGNSQDVPAVFQHEFNQNYIGIWRRHWGYLGKKYMEWMMQAYPASQYPVWAKHWTDPL
ncbi:hypothetical protein D9757_003892 [Collybiopsis confluens]|uniref:Uncharacterized protein n=1 Tax=Collybiopsis confluens TaxID=2823264 RepID=A0A8H5HV86_9AGAR|nr:hypothetical protein D9757_003892 [Collybiopsis confluens]